MIVKSILRCRKTINLPKNCYWEKTTLQGMISRHSPHSSRRWQQKQCHLFSSLSVNKFKRFLLNFPIKHVVNASLSIAELWMHSGDSWLLSSQQLEELRIVYWRNQRAQLEYEARSRYWIWLGEFSSYVIITCEDIKFSRERSPGISLMFI